MADRVEFGHGLLELAIQENAVVKADGTIVGRPHPGEVTFTAKVRAWVSS
jgi:hypothetical protein